jgi:hypothetical protein
VPLLILRARQADGVLKSSSANIHREDEAPRHPTDLAQLKSHQL